MERFILYRSLRPISVDERSAVNALIARLAGRRSWYRCEPPAFFNASAAERLIGLSTAINGLLDPITAADELADRRPPGGIIALLEILFDVSRAFGIDFEVFEDCDAATKSTIIARNIVSRTNMLLEVPSAVRHDSAMIRLHRVLGRLAARQARRAG